MVKEDVKIQKEPSFTSFTKIKKLRGINDKIAL